MRAQFQREAVVLANLSHSVLPKVTDHFSEGDGQFLVMEYIAGNDLEKLLMTRWAPFEWEQVVEWADLLLDALEYIHSQHPPVIHRDIKPANLKLTPRGQIVLLDFGLAKNATTPTRPGGSVHGYTIEYAPPEQIKGTGTDTRCDLYSLGATLYHLLTNQPPKDAKLRSELMALQAPDPLDLAHRANPQIPPPLGFVLARAMAVDRERRYPTAAAMREALREARESIKETLLEQERQKQREQEAARLLAEQQRLAEEARQRAAVEAERKQKEEAELKLRVEAERKQKEEAERKRIEQEEAERKLCAEAERKQKEEAEQKQREARERALAEQRRRAQEARKQIEPTPAPLPAPAPPGLRRGRRLAIPATAALLLTLSGYGLWNAFRR